MWIVWKKYKIQGLLCRNNFKNQNCHNVLGLKFQHYFIRLYHCHYVFPFPVGNIDYKFDSSIDSSMRYLVLDIANTRDCTNLAILDNEVEDEETPKYFKIAIATTPLTSTNVIVVQNDLNVAILDNTGELCVH